MLFNFNVLFSFSENIFGYKDLKIKLYYSAAWLSTYIGVEYSDKIDPDDFGGVEVIKYFYLYNNVFTNNYLIYFNWFIFVFL